MSSKLPPAPVSAPKALSNGTLSLRFMQNAQRARQEAQVSLAQAAVRDEAEWEVGPAQRAAWGLTADTTDPGKLAQESVSYEASYLPFINESAVASTSAPATNIWASESRLKGRREFNARGKEVVMDETVPIPVPYRFPRPVPKATKARGGPPTISGSARTASSSRAPSPPEPARRNRDRGVKKTRPLPETAAQLVVRGGADVGTDLRASRRTAVGASGFLKPAGVDAPVPKAAETGFQKPAGVDAPAPAAVASDGQAELSRNRKRARDGADERQG